MPSPCNYGCQAAVLYQREYEKARTQYFLAITGASWAAVNHLEVARWESTAASEPVGAGRAHYFWAAMSSASRSITCLLNLGLLLTGCDTRPGPAAMPSAATAVTTSPATPTPAVSGPVADLPRLRQFLRWYLAFAERRDSSVSPLLRYPLPPAGPERQEFLRQMPAADVASTPYVVLNERKAATYVDSLRASGYFSAGFLARLAASLHQRGVGLVAEPEPELGVVPGFEGDEVFDGAQDLYQPADIARLRLVLAAQQAPAAGRIYQLPLGSEGFYLYARQEQGRVVLDSIKFVEVMSGR